MINKVERAKQIGQIPMIKWTKSLCLFDEMPTKKILQFHLLKSSAGLTYHNYNCSLFSANENDSSSELFEKKLLFSLWCLHD